ncbi:MAG: type I-E CRISPR-associated protein Cas7/Cse4/CasC [Spirochaetaceae bacterium 4572_7]|nr:MAG: type I-E CRISPR-associated protein Cas7/Cse4/CasC [Spirochaetaceae bacterium 4572_7]
MSKFIQLHLLTNYAPSNLNRDDLGRPKTAKMGGVDRLRISSQSLKRAWRTSEVFEKKLSDTIGFRTKKIGLKIYQELLDSGVEENLAIDSAKAVAGIFGKNEKKSKDNPLAELEIAQLSHISPLEYEAALDLAKKLAAENRSEITKDEIANVHSNANGVDIALFGRMLASSPKYNVEAAVQVSHALTVNRVAIEDDYFTTGFGSGVFYTYICINKSELIKSLGNEELANNAIKALTEASATVAPTGKQNSYASRARAQYIMAESGTQQPRQLSSAFLKPVDSVDMANIAIDRLETLRQNMDKAYGACADGVKTMNVEKGEGTLAEILEFVGA